jgi:BirA family biotin operon repressor/biotin-[acetyl-CoA-carboxylase] ligase
MFLIELQKCASTMTEAHFCPLSISNELIVIRANLQTHGRGQYGRSWVSPEGGLWVTYLLGSRLPLKVWENLTIKVGEALQGLLMSYNVITKIKGPNDLLTCDGKKLCGILVERKPDRIMIGVGLNYVNDIPASLENSGTSLKKYLEEVKGAKSLKELPSLSDFALLLGERINQTLNSL